MLEPVPASDLCSRFLPFLLRWACTDVRSPVDGRLLPYRRRYKRIYLGEWDDPPGKLALLYDLERVAQLLTDGTEPFHPDRDRLAFARYLIELGCQPPPDDPRAPVLHGR